MKSMTQSPPPLSDTDLSALSSQGDQGAAILPFEKIDKYTTFMAEFVEKDQDLVFHFFPSPEAHASPNCRRYWYRVFPETLSSVASKVFEAGPPRLQAQLVEGVIASWDDGDTAKAVDSWWFCAKGYGARVLYRRLVDTFLKEFDVALEATKAI